MFPSPFLRIESLKEANLVAPETILAASFLDFIEII